MDWTSLPPLNSLRAFAAVAETRSYTLAAGRLNVTQAAVSQQVRALEKRLGVALVSRLGRGIELTDAGARLARDLATGFDTMCAGVERLAEAAAHRPVQITTSPAFAVDWLLPRLSEFQEAHPEITLMINPTSEVMELRPGGIDVAIRYCDRRRSGPEIDAVLVTDMIVIGAPTVVGGRDLSDPARLVDLPWLQELGTTEVADWLARHGVIPEQPPTVNHMPGNLIMSAVRRGDGITYTARAFFLDDLAQGQVVELASEPLFGVYHLDLQAGDQRPDVKAFVRWLRSKAQTVSAARPAGQKG